MASTVNVIHVQFIFIFYFFFLFNLIQRSVSVLFMIISYLFNFTGFCSYSEALLWFCYQSKFVKEGFFALWWLIYLSERGTIFCLCLSIGHQCVSPAVFSLLSKVP